MTTYMARSAWTSQPRGGAQLTGTQLVGIACHWPGTTTDRYGVESASTVAARLRGWWDYHVNVRGWSDIGYNMAVDQAGRVWDLRGLSRVGAHAASASNPDANHEWLGVLFILGDREEPTQAMVRAFQDFRHDVFLPRWPGRTSLTGHGRAPGVPGAQTSCPGSYVAAKITDGTLGATPSGEDWLNMLTASEQQEVLSAARRVDLYLDAGVAGKTNTILDQLDADSPIGTAAARVNTYLDAGIAGKTNAILAELADTPRAVQAYKISAFLAIGDVYKIARDSLMHSEVARRLAEESSVGSITAERRDQIVAEVEAKYQPVP